MTKSIKLTATIGNRDNTYSYEYTMEVDLPDNHHPAIPGLLQKGFGETLRDKFSTYKIKKTETEPERDATPAEKDKHTRVTEEALRNGTYTFGGGGARLSPEDKAWKAVLKSIGYPVKKGKSIEDTLAKATRGIAKAQNKTFEPDMVEAVKASLRERDVFKDELAYWSKPAASEDVDLADIEL